MNTEDIRTPSAEPVTQLMNQDRGTTPVMDDKGNYRNDGANTLRADAEAAPEPVDDYQAQNQAPARNPLPFWLEEKFYWHQSESGYSRLRPKVEFLNAIIADAPKIEAFGYRQAFEDETSHESDLAETLKTECQTLMQSLNALHEREANALGRWLRDRCVDNAVHAATTQFEIDNWVARAAQRGQSAAEHQNFGEKESRRDSLAVASAVMGVVARTVLDEPITEETFAKRARQLIYQRADIETRNQLNPQQEAQQAGHEVQAAVAASRPF